MESPFVAHLLTNLDKTLFGFGSKLSLVYFGIASLVAIAYYRTRLRGSSSFLKDAFGREVWLNKSAAIDVTLFVLVLAGIWNGSAFGFDYEAKFEDFFIQDWAIRSKGVWPELSASLGFQIGWTVIAVFVRELGAYWAHYMLHHVPSLWAFHAVHHSARKLNVLTLWRMHPVEIAIFAVCEGIALMMMGWIGSLLFGTASVMLFLGAYATLRGIQVLFAQFRHSMVWLPFPRLLSHLLISPAMHQVHHSQHPEHLNKNLAISLALWDWLFGTLYIPSSEDRDRLQMGISQADDLRPDSLTSLLFKPFANAWKALRTRDSQVPASETDSADAAKRAS